MKFKYFLVLTSSAVITGCSNDGSQSSGSLVPDNQSSHQLTSSVNTEPLNNNPNDSTQESHPKPEANVKHSTNVKLSSIPSSLHGIWAMSVPGGPKGCSDEYAQSQGQFLYVRDKFVSMDPNSNQCAIVKIQYDEKKSEYNLTTKCSAEGYDDWNNSEKWIVKESTLISIEMAEGTSDWVKCGDI